MSDFIKRYVSGRVPVPWLQDSTSQAYLSVLAEDKDRLIDRARTGVKMRWPAGPRAQQVAQAIGAELDATAGDTRRLALIGAGYDLPRLGSMSDAQYEAYLEAAWSTHQLGGTAEAIVNALVAYGIPDVEIVEEWQNTSGSWATPGVYGHRVCIILGPNYGTLGWEPMGSPFTMNRNAPTPPGVQGIEVLGIHRMTSAQLADIARIVRRWKDAGCTPVKLVFKFTVGGQTSPVFGIAGVPNPIPSGPDAVMFYMTGHYFNEAIDGNGDAEGVPNPLSAGPVYLLDGSG